MKGEGGKIEDLSGRLTLGRRLFPVCVTKMFIGEMIPRTELRNVCGSGGPSSGRYESAISDLCWSVRAEAVVW
jgi:hypothetical protein